jgi:Domain of unknown function (DUF4328)/Protein of unknown function (DUF2510)
VSDHTGYPGAPPGWYPDPAGGPGQRWWDGYAWTDATVLPERPPPPPWAGAPPPPATQVARPAPWAVAQERLETHNTGAVVAGELRMVGTARLAVAVPAACSLANLIINRVNANQLLAAGHQFRVDWHDSQNGITPPPYHGPTGYSPASLIVSVIFVAAAILALVWQHRAASAARALGLPAGQSPAWGVGSWFVPIVNFWIPFLAVRDCLPPGDPHRARVLHWWLTWLFAVVVGGAAGISALFSSGTALTLSIPAAVADVAVMAWAPGIVTAIAAAHRAAMERQGATTGALLG